MPSKPGTVGKDMPGALKGDQDHRGAVSSSYGPGKPSNSTPGYSHHPDNSQTVFGWTKNYIKEAREKAKEKRDNGK